MLSTTEYIISGKHMVSEHILKCTDMEKKLIRQLAERGPMSGYDFHLGGQRKRGNREALMSSGTWKTVLQHLGPLGLDLLERMEQAPVKAYDKRGRRKDLYWLTDKGVCYAMFLDVSDKLLLENAEKIYDDVSMFRFIIEIKKVLGQKAFDFAFSQVLGLSDYSPESLQKMVSNFTILGMLKARELSPMNDPHKLKSQVDAVFRKSPEVDSIHRTVKKQIKGEVDFLLGNGTD